MDPFVRFIEGEDEFGPEAFGPRSDWQATVYIGKPGPTRLHSWSSYPNQRHGYAERLYHALRIQEYVSRDAAIQWWREVGNQPGDLKVAVAQARSIVAGKNDDERDFAFMLQVQRQRWVDDPEFREALGTWTSGHIVERAPASAVDKRWGIDAQGNGRNLLGIVLMRVAREHGIGADLTGQATAAPESTPETESVGDIPLPF